MNFGFTLIRDFQESECDISLYANEDDTEAFLIFDKIKLVKNINVNYLEELIEKAGILYGVQKQALKKIIKCIQSESVNPEEKYLIAKGKKAIYGKDAYLEFHVTPSEEDPHFDIEENKTIDYKNNSLISNVSNEQHLATFHDIKTPENGMDVFGCDIPTVEPKLLKFKLGSGVIIEQDKITASTYGRFIYEQGELSVDPLYTVRGDVDLTIGNIDFIGKVIIQKDIVDDFSVSAREGIEVKGIIGAADVESDKDLIVDGGINGKGKGIIKSKGIISSKYLNEVNVFCSKDIEIRKSIINSDVKTKGKIMCLTGSIIGGSTCAYKGIEAGVVGADLGTVTHISAGLDYELEDRIREYEDKLEVIAKELRQIERVVEPVLANKVALNTFPVEKRNLILKVLKSFKVLQTEDARIREKLETINRDSMKGSVNEIRIKDVLYSGTHVTIGKCSKKIKMTIKGPLLLKEDLANDTVKISYDNE
jgi:hypothetical protein